MNNSVRGGVKAIVKNLPHLRYGQFDADVEVAVDEILDLVASKMPEKKVTMSDAMWDFPEGMEGHAQKAKLLENEGWNAYHDSVKSILKGGTDE